MGEICQFVIMMSANHSVLKLWIHIEAVKIFLKGVPTFDHPNGTDVDFGWGITGKRLGYVLYVATKPFRDLHDWLLDLMAILTTATNRQNPTSTATHNNRKND